MYAYSWFTLLYGRNQHNIVRQLSSNLKKITALTQSFGLCWIPGFPGGTLIKNSPANAGDERDAGSVPGRRRSPGGGNGNPLQYSRPGKPHGQRSLAGYSPWGHKSQTRLGDGANILDSTERAHSPSLRRTKVQFPSAKIIHKGRLYYKAPHPCGRVFGRQNFKLWEIQRITQKTDRCEHVGMTHRFHTGKASLPFYTFMTKENETKTTEQKKVNGYKSQERSELHEQHWLFKTL